MAIGRGKSSTCIISLFKPAVSLQLVQLAVCPDEVKDKQAWLLQNVRGADGLLCMLSDKVTEGMVNMRRMDGTQMKRVKQMEGEVQFCYCTIRRSGTVMVP